MTRVCTKILTTLLVICLTFSVIPMPAAWAEEEEVTADTPMPNMAEIQERVDTAFTTYDDATQKVIELQKEIDELTARIGAIELEIPQARELSNESARQYYRTFSTSNPFLEMIIGVTSLADFFATIEYTTRINQSYLDGISSLSTLRSELEEVLVKLEAQKTAIEEEQKHAEEALADAEAAQDEAEELAYKITEATAEATAAEAQTAAAEAHTPETPVKPNDSGAVEAPSDKQAFVDLWAPRIDAYLSGSPLAGYGYAFASAAYDYNVDPRWSPAISCMESSKGRYCFLPYNAWGWGYVSWPDWETAIYAHVRGLSIGYGYTISEAAAKKYCPPNWEHWYSTISSEMSRI